MTNKYLLKTTLILFLSFYFFSCKENKQSILLSDQGISNFQLLSDYEGYLITQTDFKVIQLDIQNNYEDYLVKNISKTKTLFGVEGQEKEMDIVISPLAVGTSPTFKMKHKCDEIYFNYNYYETLKKGCCSNPDKVSIYEYDNTNIINGDNNIIIGSIPNNSLDFYTSFEYKTNDKNTFGSIYFSYNSKRKYEIILKTKFELTNEYYAGVLTLNYENNKDVKTGNYHLNNIIVYTIWTLEKIKSKEEINNIEIELNIKNMNNNKVVRIPIINGKPFGKDDDKQYIEIN